MNVKQLRQSCKELQIRGYSRMNKAQLESAIYIKSVSNWYTDLCTNGSLVIEDDNLDDKNLNIEPLQDNEACKH